MSKIAIIYWSGTGNTEAMANAIADGVRGKDKDVALFSVSNFDISKINEYEKLALGCPSMGSEVLEESEFEPFFSSIESNLSGKTVALFGSYGWGDGQWMRDWQERVENTGAILIEDGLTINESPDEMGIQLCISLGEKLA